MKIKHKNNKIIFTEQINHLIFQLFAIIAVIVYFTVFIISTYMQGAYFMTISLLFVSLFLFYALWKTIEKIKRRKKIIITPNLLSFYPKEEYPDEFLLQEITDIEIEQKKNSKITDIIFHTAENSVNFKPNISNTKANEISTIINDFIKKYAAQKINLIDSLQNKDEQLCKEDLQIIKQKWKKIDKVVNINTDSKFTEKGIVAAKFILEKRVPSGDSYTNEKDFIIILNGEQSESVDSTCFHKAIWGSEIVFEYMKSSRTLFNCKVVIKNFEKKEYRIAERRITPEESYNYLIECKKKHRKFFLRPTVNSIMLTVFFGFWIGAWIEVSYKFVPIVMISLWGIANFLYFFVKIIERYRSVSGIKKKTVRVECCTLQDKYFITGIKYELYLICEDKRINCTSEQFRKLQPSDYIEIIRNIKTKEILEITRIR